MKSRPSIERACIGLLAALALHAALWLLGAQADRSARGAGAGAAVAPGVVRSAELPALQVTLLGEPLRQPAQAPAFAPAIGDFVAAEMPQAPTPAWPEIVMLLPAAEAAPALLASTIPDPPADRPDRPALPLSAPDLSTLAALNTSGAAIRLRLHIDADGVVREVELLACAPDDQAFADRLAAILRATPHIPARKGGLDVASIKEIELAFAGGA